MAASIIINEGYKACSICIEMVDISFGVSIATWRQPNGITESHLSWNRCVVQISTVLVHLLKVKLQFCIYMRILAIQRPKR